MKYAIIGCGRISPNHIAAAIENGLNIVGLCDIASERMEERSEEFNLPDSISHYENYQEMIEMEKPDLVAICTESGKHAAIALDCIDAGCNLIIEKPIALSIKDADEIIARSRYQKVKVCACHQNRFNKSIQKIREAKEAGRFGKLLYGTAHIRWNRGKQYYDQAPWRGTWAQDGGALMNQCIHNIDLLRWMMGGDIEDVVAYTDNQKHDYIEAEDFGIALLRFSNGSYGVIEGTTNIYPRNLEETLYIFGTAGTVKAGGKSTNIIEEWAFADGLDNPDAVKAEYRESPPNVYGFGHIPLYRDVVQAINDDRDPYITAEEGRNAVELVLAIYQSSYVGERVRLPISNISTLDFVGTFG
ncbi:MAG: Gfo/Idh/MocA family oxidoreductase [Clostridiaceae bacterium]|nr:Gfo/Idh/MocA family oxidoreductase [Clostridiaceae bacterium]